MKKKAARKRKPVTAPWSPRATMLEIERTQRSIERTQRFQREALARLDAKLEALRVVDTQRYCSVVIVGVFLMDGAPRTSMMSRTIGMAAGCEYNLTFEPQRPMERGAIVIGLNGAVLLDVVVGDRMVGVLNNGAGPIARIEDAVAIGMWIRVRASLGVKK